MRRWTVRASGLGAHYVVGEFVAQSDLGAIEQAKAELRRTANYDMLSWRFDAW